MRESRLTATVGYGFFGPVWRGLANAVRGTGRGRVRQQRAGFLLESGQRVPKLDLSVERAPNYGTPCTAARATVGGPTLERRICEAARRPATAIGSASRCRWRAPGAGHRSQMERSRSRGRKRGNGTGTERARRRSARAMEGGETFAARMADDSTAPDIRAATGLCRPRTSPPCPGRLVGLRDLESGEVNLPPPGGGGGWKAAVPRG